MFDHLTRRRPVELAAGVEDDRARALRFANRFAAYAHEVGIRYAKVWTPQGGGPVRVYLANEQYLSVSRSGDLGDTVRGARTFQRSALYPSLRPLYDKAVSSYRAWLDAELTKERESAEQTSMEAALDWQDVTAAIPVRPAGVFRSILAAQQAGEYTKSSEDLRDLLTPEGVLAIPSSLVRSLLIRRSIPLEVSAVIVGDKVVRVLVRARP